MGGKENACMNEKDHLGDQVVDGRIILKWIFKCIGWEGVYWIHLA
jgi:hypothetical protein